MELNVNNSISQEKEITDRAAQCNEFVYKRC